MVDHNLLQCKKLFLFDLDGTLYLGDRLFEGVRELLSAIRARDGQYRFLTNNSSRSVAAYVQKFTRLGVATEAADFLTSVDALIHYLREHGGEDRRYYVCGTESMKSQLRAAGFTVAERREDANALLMGFDTELTFQKLEDACILLGQGVPYVATNPDWVCPTAYGFVPDCGSVCEMLWRATSRRPIVIGKPEPLMPQLAMLEASVSARETLLVGDRIYTDIASGANAGIDTLLVLSGETKEEDLPTADPQPTFVLPDVAALLNILESQKGRPMANIIEIHDFSDPALDVYARLTENQLLNRADPANALFVAESPLVIGRALDAGCEPVSFLMERQHTQGKGREILARCCQDIPVYTADESVLTQLTGFHLTRGMLCAMRRPKLQSVEDVCRDARRLVVLENVMNPTNIGAIFRSAAALGMDAVLLTTAGSDPLYRRASRVSMGNVFLIPWTYLPESGNWTQLLRDLGFRTVAMALRNDSVRLDDPRLAAEEKLAIVMGTEGDGLASSTIASCDYTVRIPMYHGVDSLNVAAASAVAFYELGLPPLNEKED